MRDAAPACYTAARENGLNWKGNEVWEKCARCGTSRPARALAPFAGGKVCSDDVKWCGDLVRDRGGFEDQPSPEVAIELAPDFKPLTDEEREAIKREEAELAKKEGLH